jgi:energy-coupling factor transport system ATP-binding protein
MKMPPRIETEALCHTYPNGRMAIQDISVTLEPGDFVALIGQNGSGKTTFAKHLDGLLRPTSGRILFDGADIHKRPIGELSALVGYIFQNPDHQIFSSTVFDELAHGPRNLGLAEADVKRRVEVTIARFGLGDVAEQQPAMRRKVSVASVYAMGTPVLILDEPTTGLDWGAVKVLMSLISELNHQGHTILLITHDMRVVTEYAPRALLLHEGRALRFDSTRRIFQGPELLERLGIQIPPIVELAHRESQPPAGRFSRGAPRKATSMPLTIELYAEGDSWVYRVDPRVKLLFVFCAIIVLFVLRSAAQLFISLVVLSILLLSARVPVRRMTWALRSLLPVSLLMFAIRVIFYPAGTALLTLGPISVTWLALMQGLALGLRIMAMAFAVLAWIYTTDSDAIILSLVKLGIPYEWGFSLSLALRYIPTLSETYDMILEARQARGFNLQATRGLARVRALLPAFVSLMITSFRSTDELAKALEARAFGGRDVPRTYYRVLRFRPVDLLYTFVILVATAAAIALRMPA